MDSSDINTYYAIGIGTGETGQLDKANYGYWVSSNAPNLFDVYLMDTGNVLSHSNGDNLPCLYPFGMTYSGYIEGNSNIIAPSPGMMMEEVGYVADGADNGSNSKVYRLLIPADNTTIIFNNGKSSNAQQTGSISLTDIAANNKITKVNYKIYYSNGWQKLKLADSWKFLK